MRVVIIGAGGQGVIVADALSRAREEGAPAEAIGFVDDVRSGEFFGLPVLGTLDALSTIAHDAIIVAIGDNAARRRLSLELTVRMETVITVRHPWTSIARGVTIGAGSMISAGALVMPRATVGRGVLLNTKSSVDHDSVVGDFAHISAGATVGANVVIGDEVLIGLGASVLSGCRVGERTVIGAGAVVVRDIPSDALAYGVPARVQRRR